MQNEGLGLVDKTEDRRPRPRVHDLPQGAVFRFVDGYPPTNEYPRIYYIKGFDGEYTQLTGPSAGRVYRPAGPTTAVQQVHGVLHVERTT